MRKVKLILFIFGTLLTVSGFLLANTDNYPFVLRIVSPAYVKGMKGIKILESGKDLIPGMVGFKEIAVPLSSRLKSHQTNEQVSGYVVVKIKRPISIAQGLYTSGVKTKREIKAECGDGTPIDTTMESLTAFGRHSLIMFLAFS